MQSRKWFCNGGLAVQLRGMAAGGLESGVPDGEESNRPPSRAKLPKRG